MRLREEPPDDRAFGRTEHVAEAGDQVEVLLPELRHGDVRVVSCAELNTEDVADEPVDAVHEVNVVRYPRRRSVSSLKPLRRRDRSTKGSPPWWTRLKSPAARTSRPACARRWRLPATRRRSPSSCGLRRAWPFCGSAKESNTKPEPSSRRST